jgi:hypothetical protein
MPQAHVVYTSFVQRSMIDFQFHIIDAMYR